MSEPKATSRPGIGQSLPARIPNSTQFSRWRPSLGVFQIYSVFTHHRLQSVAETY